MGHPGLSSLGAGVNGEQIWHTVRNMAPMVRKGVGSVNAEQEVTRAWRVFVADFFCKGPDSDWTL